MYFDLLALQPHQHLPDHHFLDYTILTPRNVQVHEINSTILEATQLQEKVTYISADSVTDREYDYIQPEVLHSMSPPRFPLYKLELKNGAPLILLCNLDSIHGLFNGTRLRLIRSTSRILECCVLKESDDGDVVLIPRIALDSGLEDFPVPFCCLQFPVHLAYAMTINKSQGQPVRNIGIDLHSPVFSHGQLYVALSHCTHPRRIKVLFKERQKDTKASNIVWTEVFVHLNI